MSRLVLSVMNFHEWLISHLKGITTLVWLIIPGAGYTHSCSPPNPAVVRVHYISGLRWDWMNKEWFKFRIL